jgi:hypothetical protein
MTADVLDRVRVDMRARTAQTYVADLVLH